MNTNTSQFTPVDPEDLPWRHSIIKVLFRDGTISTGHFSPHPKNPCFWEYLGKRWVDGRRQRKYWKRLDFPIGWTSLPTES